MADLNVPNDASRKSKAEGDRWPEDDSRTQSAPERAAEDPVNRVDRSADAEAPRRYEHPVEDDDVVMPVEESVPNTKI